VHVISAQDVDADGLFPPLTPTRPYGFHSILVGPASPTTTNASSFSAAASSFIAAPGLPRYFGLGLNSRLKGRVKRTGSDNEGGSSGDSGEESEGGGSAGSHHSPPYRDPQVMKDLDIIAKLIEMQMLEESKSPHAIVTQVIEVEED